ncbi:MAG: sensor histidine kinase KdpD [Hyphomicrobium sp.]|nr:sensor histidine kinase KdpD [Hyphomicrobium sp.]
MPTQADRTPPRASSEALLELAAKEQRGKLKVYLGMAPGVGKTYAMLSAARTAKSEGRDVVIGLVETHGRSETQALVDGLEVIPRRTVAYRNRVLMEFDIDAAITRRPELLLVDEFAHTNAPGLVHGKRYQDVEGVLQAGIDVWTTLNIQHLESLTDVVEKISGITVRETVPDRVLDRADEIVVVDLPPEDLIQRLKEGKVYLPENARRAIDRFFQPSNLTALRELALRRTADQVDEQMLTQLRQRGVEGSWPTAERLLVCVGGDEQSERVIRTAARMAAALKSDWIAIHLALADKEDENRTPRKRIDKAMRLAERLGATTVRVLAKDLTAEILNYAKRNNITQIVVGRSVPSGWHGIFRRSLSDEITAKAKGLSVTVIAPETEAVSARAFTLPDRNTLAAGSVAAVLAVGAAVGTGLALERLTPLPNMSMIFLLAVLICAFRFGVSAAVSASVLSFFAYNFFFIEPRHTFTIARPHELFALLIFLAVAIVTGGLAGRLRDQANATSARAEATQSLYDFSRKLSGAPKIDDVVWLIASQSAAIAGGRAVVLLTKNGDLNLEGAWPPEDSLSTSDWAAARWSVSKGEPGGNFTPTMPSATFHFRPMMSSKGSLGVIGVALPDEEDFLPAATESALQSFADQAAIAIERTLLVEETARMASAAESERLRSALLSSVSHDLRTPLASILGSVTSLRQLGDRIPKADQAELLTTIEEETTRLTQFVTNLLDMTRLEAGALDIRRDWIDVADVIRGAVNRSRKLTPKRKIELNVSENLPFVKGDATLLEQVIFNLIDNADKYSPKASVTSISAATQKMGVIVVRVSDSGQGIPPGSLERIFDKFYRLAGSDGRTPGTGLGLAIAAGVIRAMGGDISARSPVNNGRGTEISIMLPASAEATNLTAASA